MDENEFCVFRNNLQETYEPREYCVQYRETDFAFLSRLMEEEGIFYYFVHENNCHTMVLPPYRMKTSFSYWKKQRPLEVKNIQ